MGKLDGRIAVVTGAAKGIGASISKHLALEGAAVVVNYASDAAGAEKVVAGIVGARGRAIAVRASVALETEVGSLIEAAIKAFGKVDILVNNAGVYEFGAIETVSAESFGRQFNTNVLGTLFTTKAALPFFPGKGGSIINVSSVVSSMAPPTASIYAATKGALDTITKVLAKELGPRNIRVNAVNPGMVLTEGLQTSGLAGGAFETQMIGLTPLGRVGHPDDIALPVVFLASDDARWITGVTLQVSGGAGM